MWKMYTALTIRMLGGTGKDASFKQNRKQRGKDWQVRVEKGGGTSAQLSITESRLCVTETKSVTLVHTPSHSTGGSTMIQDTFLQASRELSKSRASLHEWCSTGLCSSHTDSLLLTANTMYSSECQSINI